MSESVRSFEGAPTLFPRGVRRRWPWSLRIVFGLLVAVAGFLGWREFEPLLLFRPVNGVVVDASIETVQIPERGSGHRTRYVPTVTYRYAVGGETFTGARYARTAMAGTQGQARRVSRRYLRGTRVQVWYDPRQPAEAVLSRAPNPVLLVILCVVIFMTWLFSAAAVAARPQPDEPAVAPPPSIS